jgi:hypothetical protein
VNGNHTVILPVDNETEIYKYEIQEGKLGCDNNSFVIIHSSKHVKSVGNNFLIDLEFIGKKSRMQYKLCVITTKGETKEFPPFLYDKNAQKFISVEDYVKGKNN